MMIRAKGRKIICRYCKLEVPEWIENVKGERAYHEDMCIERAIKEEERAVTEGRLTVDEKTMRSIWERKSKSRAKH